MTKELGTCARPSLDAFALALLPIGAYIIESILVAAIQIRLTVGNFALGMTLLAALPNIIFILLSGVIFALIHERTRERLRWIIILVFSFFMALVLTLNAASHAYFLATGSNLSWSALEVWLHSMADSNRVIQSEASWDRLAFLGLQPLIPVANLLLLQIPWVRRRLCGFALRFTARGWKAIAVAIVLATVAFVLPKPHGRAMALARCVPCTMVRDAVRRTIAAFRPSNDLPLTAQGHLEFHSPANAPRPNIVLVILESWNWKSTDIHVPGKNITPFLGELSKKSAIVDSQYTIVPHTTKSIVSILCGIEPFIDPRPNETVPNILPKRCLPHILGDQGYDTAFFQPAYNFEQRDQLVANMGFATYRGSSDLPGQGFEIPSYFGYEDKVMTRPSMAWIDRVRQNDRPFFITYLTLASHHNYVTPQSFQEVAFDSVNRHQYNYFNALRYLDSFVSELLKEFEARDLVKNTVFIFTGDHGEAFGEHARGQHDLVLWEEGIRTAAMIYAPTYFPKPEHITGVRSHLDWVPTICDLLDLTPVNGSFQGSSLLQPVANERKLFFSCWFNDQCLAMREGPIKTIYHYDILPPEVFDNANDPLDEHNLAHSSAYSDSFIDPRIEEMQSWRDAVNQRYRQWEHQLVAGKISRQPPPIRNPVSVRFGEAIELIGYDVSTQEPRTGQRVRVAYVFKVLGDIEPGMELFVHLRAPGRFANLDHVPVNGNYPVSRWRKGDFIVDEHEIQVPSSWPSGVATLDVGFWSRKTHQRLPISQTSLPTTNNQVTVTELSIIRDDTTPLDNSATWREKISSAVSVTPPTLANAQNVVFGDKIELVDAEVRDTTVELAGTLELSFVFHAVTKVTDDWRVVVRLVNKAGTEIRSEHVPVGGLYPTSLWNAGEYIKDRHKFHIDHYRSQPGEYAVWVTLAKGSSSIPARGQGTLDSRLGVKFATINIVKPTIQMVR